MHMESAGINEMRYYPDIDEVYVHVRMQPLKGWDQENGPSIRLYSP
jgi:hypothetical protein